MYSFASIPLCLSTAALQSGNSLHPAVPLHLFDAESAVLIGSTLQVAILSICSVAVRKTNWFPKLPPHSGELVQQLMTKKRHNRVVKISDLKCMFSVSISYCSTLSLVSLTHSSSISCSLPRDIHCFGCGVLLTSFSNTSSFSLSGSGGCTTQKELY